MPRAARSIVTAAFAALLLLAAAPVASAATDTGAPSSSPVSSQVIGWD